MLNCVLHVNFAILKGYYKMTLLNFQNMFPVKVNHTIKFIILLFLEAIFSSTCLVTIFNSRKKSTALSISSSQTTRLNL